MVIYSDFEAVIYLNWTVNLILGLFRGRYKVTEMINAFPDCDFMCYDLFASKFSFRFEPKHLQYSRNNKNHLRIVQNQKIQNLSSKV